MWTTDSSWFEIAIVSMIYAIGNMVMGHFEERTPKRRRVGKYILTLVIVYGMSILFGRTVSMIVPGASLLPILYVHAYYLPEKKESTAGRESQRAGIMNFASRTKTYLQSNGTGAAN